MKKLLILIVLILNVLPNIIVADDYISKKVYFQLPAVVDEEEIQTSLILGIHLAKYNGLVINDGMMNNVNLNGEKSLYEVFEAVKSGNRQKFNDLSIKQDPDLEEAWKFYQTFLKQAVNPEIIFRFDVGNLRTFYIKTGEGPLMAIGLTSINGVYLHSPSYVNQSVMQSVSELANHYYSMPNEYSYKDKMPITNTRVDFDSLYGNLGTENSVTYLFNSYKVNYDAETGLILPANDESLASLLGFYRTTLEKFRLNDTASYFGAFSLSSRTRAYETLQGITKKDFEYYKKMKLSFNKVGYIIPMGKINVLFFRNTLTKPDVGGNIVKTYVFNSQGFQITNEFMEFYLDDIMKEKKFMNTFNAN